MTLILAQLLLDGRKHLGLHERRYGNGEPVLAGDVHRGDRPARLQGAATVGAQPGAEGLLPRFAKGAALLERGRVDRKSINYSK